MNAAAFHIAKLALFNNRLISELESRRAEVAAFDDLVVERARKDNVALPINLLHQATFLQFAYITLVWLWEQAVESNSLQAFETGVTQRFQFNTITKVSGPRDLHAPAHFLRLLRNAISHGRVRFEENRVIMSDFNEQTEETPTEVAMTWSDLRKLSEAVLFSTNDILYPGDMYTGA